MNKKEKLVSILIGYKNIAAEQEWQIQTRESLIDYTRYTHNNPQLLERVFGIIKECNNITTATSFASLIFVVLFSWSLFPVLDTEQNNTPSFQDSDSIFTINTDIDSDDIEVLNFTENFQAQRQSLQQANHATINELDTRSASNAFQDYIAQINRLSDSENSESQDAIIQEASAEAQRLSGHLGLQNISPAESYEYALRVTLVKRMERCENSALLARARHEISLGTVIGLVNANEYINRCLHITQNQQVI